MVSNVSMSGVNPNDVEFAKKAIKYVQGQKIKEDNLGDELASGVKGTTAFATAMTLPKTKRISWAIKHRKEYGDTFSKGVDAAYEDYKTAKQIAKTVKKTGKTVEEVKTEFEAAKKAAEAANEAKEAAATVGKTAKKTGILSKLIAPVKKALSKVTAPIGKALSKVGEKTGVTKLLTKFPKISKVLKGSKGFFLINMVISTLTEVIPAFKQGGIKEGFKQLGRTVLRSGTEAIGFTAGMEIGSALGTALFPGVGTVIGGLIGSALGMVIGGAINTISSKVIDKTVGEDFSKQQAKKEEQAQAEAIASDPEAMNELKELVELKILQDTQTGKKKAIKNAAKMQEMLEELPETESSDMTENIAFNASSADQAVNKAVRLSEANQTTTNPFTPEQTSTEAPTQNPFQPQNQTQAETPQQPVWSPRTVGEITSGLYDQNGHIKLIA